MLKTMAGIAILAVGSALLAYATIGRYFGIHRPMKWRGGGKTTLVGELAIGGFIICFGLAVLQHSPVWILPAAAILVVIFCSQERARRRHAAEENELRARNSADYPGVFDHPGPNDLNSVAGDELDLFDLVTYAYLGRASKGDVQALIKRFCELPEQGPNDIYLEEEFLSALTPDLVSQRFITMLNAAFEQRDRLVLRWMPPSAKMNSSATAGQPEGGLSDFI